MWLLVAANLIEAFSQALANKKEKEMEIDPVFTHATAK